MLGGFDVWSGRGKSNANVEILWIFDDATSLDRAIRVID